MFEIIYTPKYPLQAKYDTLNYSTIVKKRKHLIKNKKTAAPKDGLNTRDLHEKIKRIGYLKPFYREICTRIKSLKQLLSNRRRCHPLPVHYSPGNL